MPNRFDPTTAPVGEPQIIVVGDLVQWRRTDLFADYPHTVYAITYVARQSADSSGAEFTVTGSVTNNEWVFSIPSATSSSFVAGNYFWQLEIRRLSDSERVVVNRGSWDVFVDLDNAADPRSFAQRILDRVEALLEGKFVHDADSISVNGRTLSKMDQEDLQQTRNNMIAEVRREQAFERIALGLPSKQTIKVFF